MIFDKMYNQSDIMGAALKAASVRNEVITNNIANNDVPGYKSKKVSFEDSLLNAIERKNQTGTLDLSDVFPKVQVANGDYDYRIDQNNVNVELEMVNLYQNSIKYEALINGVLNNSRRMGLALTGRAS